MLALLAGYSGKTMAEKTKTIGFRLGGDTLKPANMIIPNYQRRSAEDEVLLPWGEADFKRLGLSKEKEPAMPMKLEFEDGAPRLENEEGTQGEGEENYAKLMTLFNKDKT